jgi:putative membrane protein
MDLFLDTVLLRPYVFLFLLIYLIGCSIQFGVKPALSFLLVGYLLAFGSELSSIHWGFPYGDYYYIPSTIGRELWVLGVPFMDSLSYVFLAACSYTTALFLLCPFLRDRRGFSLSDTTIQRQGWAPWILGAILMVFLDVIIDPLALQGERWFLGKIYGYRTPGSYFGIPMSNFGGWLLVGLVMIKVFQLILRLWEKQPLDLRWKGLAVVPVWGPLLYIGILIFNLAITLAIGEITLWLVGVFLTGIFLSMGGALILYKLQHPLSSDDRL